MLRDRRHHRPVFEQLQALKRLAGQRAIDETRGLRPARRVDDEARKPGIAKERGQRDIGDRHRAEQESVGRQFAFQVVQHRRYLLGQCARNLLAIALLAEHRRQDHLLVEQPPDEQIAQAGVGQLFEPAGPGAPGRAGRHQRGAGIALFEVFADHRRIDQRDLVVDEHRHAPQRAQFAELVVAVERHDRIDLVGDALDFQAHQHLANIRRDVVADDANRLRHVVPPVMSCPLIRVYPTGASGPGWRHGCAR